MSDINISIPAGAKKRLKTGGKYCPEDVVVTAEGMDTSDATATPETILSGRTAYVNGEKITGSMPNRNRISVALTPTGASVSGDEGYYSGVYARVSSATRTVTPSKNTQVASSDNYFYSEVTVNPIPDEYIETSDADATAADIAQGKTAYVDGQKITGTHTELDTGDATAIAENILSGKTAYVNGAKITGSMPNNSPMNIKLGNDEMYTIPKGYHNGTGTITGVAASVIEDLNVTANGTYTAPDGVDGYSPVTVNVPAGAKIKTGTFTAAESGVAQTIAHGMAKIPGAILLFKNGTRKSGAAGGTGGEDYNFYESLFAGKFSDSVYMYAYNYVRKMSYYSSSSATTPTETITYSGNYSKASTTSTIYGLSDITATAFTTPRYLISGASYFWIAFEDPIM